MEIAAFVHIIGVAIPVIIHSVFGLKINMNLIHLITLITVVQIKNSIRVLIETAQRKQCCSCSGVHFVEVI